MGLDMFLVKTGRVDKLDLMTADCTEIGYWRKANHIHNWFVENVQGGEDKCNPFEVSEEQINELLNVCLKVKSNKELASELLPTRAGFFFGSCEYDDYYWECVDDTVEFCERVNREVDFTKDVLFYQSSW